MKPVLVLQHQTQDHAAGLARWLREQGIAFEVRNAEAGELPPASMDGYRALALLGGEMSANDPLPALRRAEALILESMERELPVIGHCLGGQLMARALGARIVASPAPEIGWQTLQVHDTPEALDWFGRAGAHTVFHWHFEAFELPQGATPLAWSEACPVQAFSIGRHLAMQFHVEVDEEKLGRWSATCDPDYIARQGRVPTVQDGAAMRAGAVAGLPLQRRLQYRLYRRWLGLAGD